VGVLLVAVALVAGVALLFVVLGVALLLVVLVFLFQPV